MTGSPSTAATSKMIGSADCWAARISPRGAHVNHTDLLVVEKVWASDFGDAILSLSGGYRLVIFPSGSCGEAWRIFRPGAHPHFVVDEESAAWSPA